MKKKIVNLTFRDMDDAMLFIKKIDDFSSYRIQIVIFYQFYEEMFERTLPIFEYTSYITFYENVSKDFYKCFEGSSGNSTNQKRVVVNFIIISDEVEVIDQKKLYLLELYGNKVAYNFYKIKI